MPVTTRGMRQRNRNLAASLHAPSGAAASSSRTPTFAPAGQPARRSNRRPARESALRRESRRRPLDDDDDNNNSDSGSENESDPADEDAEDVINEIMSTLADSYPVPEEFSRIGSSNARDAFGTEQTRDCRSLARVLSTIIGLHPETQALLRREFPRARCAARLVHNLWLRDAAITRNLYANLENQAEGRDVPYSIVDWRNLSLAVELTLTTYRRSLSSENRHSLAALLVSILDRIVQCDRDLYAGRNRTVYAGESSGGNLFRRFLSSRAQPIDFLGPLSRLDPSLLATQTDALRGLINRYTENGRTVSDGEQYNLVAQALWSIWNRVAGQQS